MKRHDDPAVVRGEYASEQGLAARSSVYAGADGPDPRDVTFQIVSRLAPRTILEVGCGQGELAARFACKLRAPVIAVDLSERMVELARERGVDARIADVQQLPFDDDTFDCAGSQFGVMLFPDLPRGLGEMVRVTRPGGRVALTVYGPPTQIDFLTFCMAAIEAVAPDAPDVPMDPPPLPFQVADPRKFHTALANAGLRDITVETITEKLEFRSGTQLWDWIGNSNPIGAELVGHLTLKQREAACAVLDDMLRERAGADGTATLTNPIHIGVGTV